MVSAALRMKLAATARFLCLTQRWVEVVGGEGEWWARKEGEKEDVAARERLT